MSRRKFLVVGFKMLPKSHCMLKAKTFSFIFLEEAFSNSCGRLKALAKLYLAPTSSLRIMTEYSSFQLTGVFVDDVESRSNAPA